MKARFLLFGLLLIALVVLSACGSSEGVGKLSVNAPNAPFPTQEEADKASEWTGRAHFVYTAVMELREGIDQKNKHIRDLIDRNGGIELLSSEDKRLLDGMVERRDKLIIDHDWLAFNYPDAIGQALGENPKATDRLPRTLSPYGS